MSAKIVSLVSMDASTQDADRAAMRKVRETLYAGSSEDDGSTTERAGYDWRTWLTDMQPGDVWWYEHGTMAQRGSIGRAARYVGMDDVRVAPASRYGRDGILVYRMDADELKERGVVFDD